MGFLTLINNISLKSIIFFILQKVRDVNDNRPQFEKIDCVGHLSRHVSIGTEIMTLSAIDFDVGNFIR